MECGKLTAKLRDAVPVCFIVDGKEVKRYKNIEIPDEIKKLPFKAFDFNVPLTGAITFKISFEPGVLPEVWPEKRQRKSRAAKAAEAEIPANVTEAIQHALEQAEAEGQPVQDVAEAAMNGAEVRAEVNGPEIIITAEDGEETAESAEPEEAPQEYSMALYYHVTGEQRKALVTAVSAFVDAPAVYQNAPTFAYAIGEYSVDKEGTLTGPAKRGAGGGAAGEGIYGGIILGQTKSAHAEVILPDMSAFLTVVVLFVFHLARHGGEAPCGAFFGVKGAAGFLAQFLAGDEFGHGGHFLSTNRI